MPVTQSLQVLYRRANGAVTDLFLFAGAITRLRPPKTENYSRKPWNCSFFCCINTTAPVMPNLPGLGRVYLVLRRADTVSLIDFSHPPMLHIVGKEKCAYLCVPGAPWLKYINCIYPARKYSRTALRACALKPRQCTIHRTEYRQETSSIYSR